MLTHLTKMSAAAFSAYLEKAIADYAEENVQSGRWPAEGALERSRNDHQQLLPEGVDTPQNHLFEITRSDDDVSVGVLWLAEDHRYGAHSAFIYDIEVRPEHRRRGHARRALLAAEALVRGWGVTHLGLNVFRQNAAAHALYRQLGFADVSTNMVKKLR